MSESFKLSRRAAIALAAGFAGASALPAFAQDAEDAANAIVVPERAIGSPDALLTMYEYASFTCPHCKNFHNDVLPELTADYIETGKIRLVYRAVYFDRLGLWADLLAHCGGEERYFGLAKLIYETQSEWTRGETAQDVVDNLKALGRQAGLLDDDMDACMRDNDFARALVEEFQKNADADGISGTPTFVINGEKISNQPYKDLKIELDRRLAEL